jgi:iron complex transport system ATP-binding protein
VTLDGTELSHVPRARIARRMAVVPQETHLAFDYTALEMVLMGRYPHLGAFEIEGPDDVAIARQSLEATGTLALQDRLFSTLSGGEKQRVVIASALAQIGRPGASAAPSNNILLLDEPTAALDLAYQLEVASLLRELQERLPIAIVVSTHDLNFAASLCRTIVLLKAGDVLASGPTDDVITPSRIRDLYGVDAEVERRQSTGRLVVVPVGRSRAREAR